MTELAGARALITGGAGVVGSTIVDALVPLGLDEIIVFDDFCAGCTRTWPTSPADRRRPAHRRWRRTCATVTRSRSAMAGVDVVFHQAAIRLPHCAKDPRLAMEVMVDGTFNVVEAAHAAGVSRFVAASSASVYGSATAFPITEEHDSYGNRTLYGAAKVFGEQLYRSYHEMFGFDYVALRYFNVYGPRMDAHTAYTEVLIRWMQRIDDGLPPMIHGAGDQTMDFVYVTDVARANVLAATASVSDEVYNVATGVETSLVELARALLDAMGSELDVEFGPDRDVPAVERRLAAHRPGDARPRASPRRSISPRASPDSSRGGARGHARLNVVEVVDVDACTDPRWHDLEARAGGSLFHGAEWAAVLADTYRFAPRALLALDGGQRRQRDAVVPGRRSWRSADRVAAVQRLLRTRRRSRRSHRCSTPWSGTGSRCAPAWSSTPTRATPIAPRPGSAPPGVARWHGVPVTAAPDADAWPALGDSTRRAVAKARRDGVTVVDRTDAAFVDDFFRLHLGVRKDKYRLLPQPRAFFAPMQTRFGATR